MVERIEEMPEGTIGFEFDGEVTGAEYREILEPALEEAVEAGEVRLLLRTAASFDGMGIGARIEDAKANLKFGLAHRKAWKRVAIVTDSGWLTSTFRLWSHLVPVEMQVFPLAEDAAARNWVAAD
ncbi:MAG TPA: STAS/SEC14 domain-containing protein [Solirubrobacterales bacterium]|nr:STAS/SEC14 domain-containing protein [Solirubrobacterales bacterium]